MAKTGRHKNQTTKSEKAHIPITGMTCTTCAATIEKGLAKTPGVERAEVNFASEKASVEYDPSKVDLAKIKDTISRVGLRDRHQEIHLPGKRDDLCLLCCPRGAGSVQLCPG